MAKTQYEGMFLLPTSVGDENAAITLVRGIIERHEGKILVIKKWDERKLTYEIKKQKRGVYVLAYFTSPGGAIGAITRDCNLSDNVLRVLITDASHLNQEEMAAMEPQPPAPREERPAGDFGGVRGFDRGFGGDRPARGPRRDEGAPAGDTANA
jgi:ribosomal protein S6